MKLNRRDFMRMALGGAVAAALPLPAVKAEDNGIKWATGGIVEKSDVKYINLDHEFLLPKFGKGDIEVTLNYDGSVIKAEELLGGFHGNEIMFGRIDNR